MIAATLAVSSAGWSAQGDGERLALSMRDNVVGITAHRGGRQIDGFGIIAGERNGQLYIVTANHVLRGQGPDDIATRLAVRFHQSPEIIIDGKLLGVSDRSYDIGVITTPVPPGIQWHRPSLRADPMVQRGTPVWFVGRGGTWYVPTQPGTLNSVTLAFRILIDNLNVQVGTSGAPVIAPDGIIGMVVDDEPGATSGALAIDIVRRAFALWELPWDLEPLKALTAIPALSPEAELHVAAGDHFREVGNIRLAIEEFRAANVADPRNSQVLLKLVSAMRLDLWQRKGIPRAIFGSLTVKDYDYAQQIIQTIYRAQGAEPALRNNVRWLLEEAYVRRASGQDFQVAIQPLEKALSIAPEDPQVLAELGLLKTHFTSKGQDLKANFTQGLDYLRKAAQIDPDSVVFRRYLADTIALLDVQIALRHYYAISQMNSEADWRAKMSKSGAIRDAAKHLIDWIKSGEAPKSDQPLSPSELASILEAVLQSGETSTSDQIWIARFLAQQYFLSEHYAQAERVIRDQLRGFERGIDDFLSHRGIGADNVGVPDLVVFARVLEHTASDPGTLLALRLFLGCRNVLSVALSDVGAFGPYVDRVLGNGLANVVGMSEGDEILKIDGESTPTISSLARALVAKAPGQPVRFEISGSNGTRSGTGTIPIGETPPTGPGFLGITMRAIPHGRSEFYAEEIEIVEVVAGSPAERAGLRPDDRIIEANGLRLFGPSHLQYMIGCLSAGDVIELHINRPGGRNFFAVRILLGSHMD